MNETRAIAAVLASYIYGDFVPMGNDVSISDYWFYKNMSKHDLYVFSTKNRSKVFFTFRGTTNMNEAITTWPIIASSTENIRRNFWSSYFNDRIEYVAEKLKFFPKENLEIFFSGHSLGGTMSRVASLHFNDLGYNSKGFSFNPGNGILSNRIVNTIAQKFLKSHVNKAVKFLTPNGVPDEVVTILKQSTIDPIIKEWTNFTKFHPPNNEIHRTNGDVVSLLGGFGDDTTTYESPGRWWDVLSNHDMDHLSNRVQEDSNFFFNVQEDVKKEEELKDLKVFRIRKFLSHKGNVPKPPHIDLLHPEIKMFTPWITLSRNIF